MGWRQRLTTPPWPQAGPARSAGSCSEIPVNRLGLTLSQGSAGDGGRGRGVGGWDEQGLLWSQRQVADCLLISPSQAKLGGPAQATGS